GFVADGGRGQRDPRRIGSQAPHRLQPVCAPEGEQLFRVVAREAWEQRRDRLAQSRGRRHTEEALGGTRPPGHAALTGDRDAGVADGGEGALCQLWGCPACCSHPIDRTSCVNCAGSSVRRMPHAAWIALATAAGPGTAGGSPTPLAPNGPRGEGISRSSTPISGTWSMVGRE